MYNRKINKVMKMNSTIHQKLDKYRKIASSNTSRLEAHVGFFRLLMKGVFGPKQKVDFLISNAH